MSRHPRYHIHLCQLVPEERTVPTFEPHLFADAFSGFDATDSAVASQLASDQALGLLDTRIGRVEVIEPRMSRKNGSDAVASPLASMSLREDASVPVATFEKQDAFAVEALDEGQDATQVAFGILHLYRTVEDAARAREAPEPACGGAGREGSEPSTDAPAAGDDDADESEGKILAMLSIPGMLSASALMDFIHPAMEAISHIRMIRCVRIQHACLTVQRGQL